MALEKEKAGLVGYFSELCSVEQRAFYFPKTLTGLRQLPFLFEILQKHIFGETVLLSLDVYK